MTRIPKLKTRINTLEMTRVGTLPKQVDRIYSTPAWLGLMAKLKRERGNKCERCESRGRVVGDHIVELKDGGAAYEPSNVRLLCWGCHTAKTNIERAKRLNAPLQR